MSDKQLDKIKIDLKYGFGHIYVNDNEVPGVAKLELESNPGEPTQVILTLIPKEVEVNIDGAEVRTSELGKQYYEYHKADPSLSQVSSKIDE